MPSRTIADAFHNMISKVGWFRQTGESSLRLDDSVWFSAPAGKTLNVTQQLTSTFPAEVIPIFLTFSARTSANQTQDIIDSKMDKRRKVCLATVIPAR